MWSQARACGFHSLPPQTEFHCALVCCSSLVVLASVCLRKAASTCFRRLYLSHHTSLLMFYISVHCISILYCFHIISDYL